MKRKRLWENRWIQAYVILVILQILINPLKDVQDFPFLVNLFLYLLADFLFLFLPYTYVQAKRKHATARQEASRKRDETWRNIKEKEQYLKHKKPSGDPSTTCRGCGASLPVNEAKCPYCGLKNPHYSKY